MAKKRTHPSVRIKTLKVRVRDKHCARLRAMARSVNFVWNYINALSHRSIRERGTFLSAFDLHPYTKGAGKELGLHSQTLQEVAEEYVTRRIQFKKSKLNWRKSGGSHRSLGWIPVKKGSASWKNGQIFHNGNYYKVWDSYGLANYPFLCARFCEDTRGRWYFHVAVAVPKEAHTGSGSVGIDLGCADAIADSNGEKVPGRHYRELEQKLGLAQRARNKKRVRAIHAKIKHRRQDDLHRYTRKLVNENAAIFVGNVSSQAMVKTRLAKSALDASWGMIKTMLDYKCAHAGIVFEEVNEAYTTQTCSCCGSRQNSPKGRTGLGIREWTCGCGVTHDRDLNAARSILALGHQRLAGGISTLNPLPG